ncbi:ParB N-terminal domain-containing protein [Pseudomonas moraviensis subsp. stanleyae]|nr:ParB N-terminal domain-containing protein [Pseudomonas moraviensis subsp. stanleyae]
MGKTSTKLVELMRDDMRSNGFNSDHPIDVAEHNGTLYILDGHHRASAARQTSTEVTIQLITNIRDHHGTLNTIEEVLESADNVGNDRLEHRRRR